MAALFALMNALCGGATAVAMGIGVRRNDDLAAGMCVMTTIGAVLTTAVAVLSAPASSALDLHDMWPFAAGGALGAGLGAALFMRAVYHIGPARTAVIAGASPVLASVVSIVALEEPLRVVLVLATAMIMCGGIALSSERVEARPTGFRPIGLLFAFGALTCIGLYQVIFRWGFRRADPDPYVAAAAAGIAAALVGSAYALTASGIRAIARAIPAFWPAGIVSGLAVSTSILAFERGKVTVVSPLAATHSLFAIVLSALLFRQRERITVQVVLAALLIVLGSALVSAVR